MLKSDSKFMRKDLVMSQGAINSTGTHYWTFTATTTSTRLDFSAT